MSGPRSMQWCFTLNNYTEEEEAAFKEFADVKYMIFGHEVGEEGTPHLQGFFSLTKRFFRSQLKAQFPRAHFEVAYGSPTKNREYCTKHDKDGFFEKGEMRQGKRTDLEELRDDIESGQRNPKVLRRTHSAALKYPQVVRQLLIDNQPKPATPEISLRSWQVDLMELLTQAPDDRKIYFIVDTQGNAGKSTFCDYVESLLDDVQVMKPARYIDMAYELEETVKILLFDCPRSRSEVMQYHFLEDVKDGRVTSSKYNSFQKRLGKVHVVVFMNEDPDMNALSNDRYVIRRV